MIDFLAELLRGAIKESECVALFTICIILIVVMHAQNTRKLDSLRQRLSEHTNKCPYGED